MTCDPKSLMDQARCFRCLPAGELRGVMIYLLCSWLKRKEPPEPPGPDYPCGVPSNTIEISGGGFPGNGIYTWNPSISLWLNLADPNYYIYFDAKNGWWSLFWAADVDQDIYTSTTDIFPCTWSVVQNDPPSPPAPTGQYI